MKKKKTQAKQLDRSLPTYERHNTIIIPPKTNYKVNMKDVFDNPPKDKKKVSNKKK